MTAPARSDARSHPQDPVAASQGTADAPRLTLQLNGAPFDARVPRAATLLQVLRNDAGCNGPKYGCGLGQCGACTVLVDGRVARACVIPAHGVAGRSITTVEGLGTREAPHPVQRAFIDAQAAQCGYCTSGLVMATVALLERCPQPSDVQIHDALSHNLCRCGAHVEILQAVHLAARHLATGLPTTGQTAEPEHVADLHLASGLPR
jgi:nicotinate dehydrogenase subunit A